jgi:WD40 repeat protein
MGCQDGTIKVCTLEGGNATVGSFVAHRRSVTSLSESLDCSLLVSYSDFEFTLRVWDIFAPALGLISSDGAIYEGWIITDDGWVMNNKQHLLFWLPPDIASAWCSPYAWLVITKTGILQVPKQKPFIGDEWIKCYSPV